MFFILSKLLNFFLDPLNLLAISFIIFLLINARIKKNKFKGIVWFVLFWALLLYKPIPEFLIKNLEDKFSYKEDTFIELEGIIVLGGSTGSGKIAKERNDISLGPGAERVFKGLQFLQQQPEGTVIFTGLSGSLFHEGLSEAEITEKLIKALKIDAKKILFEKRSRNTFENAFYTGMLIDDLKIKKWGIVTSANHMKRAIATFEKQHPKIVFEAIPVDFQTANQIYWSPGSMQGSINLWRIYIHETVGYLVYKLTRKL